MFKKIIFALILILSLNFVYSKNIDYTTLGQNEFFKIEKGQELCKVYDFDRLIEEEGSKLIAGINIENYIPTKGELELSIFLNDSLVTTLKNTEILEKNIIEINRNMNSKNQLKICVKNKALPIIIISPDSFIGTYLLGQIKDIDFYQNIIGEQQYTKALIPIEIFAHNSGQDNLYVDIKYATDKFLENSNLETVSGQTTYSGIIEPNQTITLKYYLKTNKDIEFATPIAQLAYTDEFNRDYLIKAKQGFFKVEDNLNKIEVYIDLEKNLQVNVPKTGKIILKNISQTNIKNINIETNFGGKLILSNRQLTQLKRFEVIEIPFEITTDNVGDYTFNTSVYYNLGNEESGVESETLILTTDYKTDYVKETIGVFLVIAIIAYIWIVRF